MAKIFIYPNNSLILSDLVKRFGHEPLTTMNAVGKRVRESGLDSPPINITADDPYKGLKYAAIEVPSGVRGRMSLLDPLLEVSEAAIIVEDSFVAFGCMGCNRTNELLKLILRGKKIPILEINYPTTAEDTREFVYNIRKFLTELEGGDEQ